MDILSKAQSLLQHMYDSGGGEYKDFRFVPVSDHSVCHATNATEFEEILNYAKDYRWLKWRKRDTFSLGRAVYHGVQLTYQGMERLSQNPLSIESLTKCPLTGLPLNGQATFELLNGAEQVLYSFKPIGQAIFNLSHLTEIARAIAADNQRLYPDLAAHCREAFERKESVLTITYDMLTGADIDGPKTFEDKQAHFLRLLYDTGSKEYKERDLYINQDFTLAFAENPEEFTRILKALITKGLLQYDKPNDTPNDWPYGIRTVYRGVLLTPSGEQRVIKTSPSKSTPSMPASSRSSRVSKVFISHASKDVKYVEELIDLLKLMGLRKNQIFCTSVRGYGIPLGTNFLAELKERISDEVLVLFVFSPNFFASRICLAELGAAWVLSKEHVPIVIPPFGFGDIQGVLPHTQGMVLNDALQINELAEKIESLFGVGSHAENDDWERSRGRIIDRINHSIGQDATRRAATEATGKDDSFPS